MKAFLLAAGLGTRLRPLTDITPKCLVKVYNKTILDWWIDLFLKHGIDEVLINLHHFPEKVKDHLKKNNRGIKFTFFEEPELLGSGGTLRENYDFVKNEEIFFITYADNLTNYNLSSFIKYHKEKKTKYSMALFYTDAPKTKGIAEIDASGKIISFEEKPPQPKSNLANAGIYISHPEILKLIPNYKITDIGFHLLPKLVGNMYGWITKDYLIDIGTINHLQKAELDWQQIIERSNYGVSSI
jgi:mannose-1-phosphate guanylyltransferase